MRYVDVIQEAKKRLAAIEAGALEFRLFLADAEKFGATQVPMDTAVAALARAINPPAPTHVSEIRNRAKAIISAVGRPVPLGELYSCLIRSGVVIGGKDPRSNLSAKLNGDPELASLPRQGWWLRNEDGSIREIKGGADSSVQTVARPAPVDSSPTPPTSFTGTECIQANGTLRAKEEPQFPDRDPGKEHPMRQAALRD
jgi:hypothetical protein